MTELIELHGGLVEIFVSTSIEVCDGRDTKWLYAKARAGALKNFADIDDPYEVPESPDLEIDTEDQSPEEAAQRILLKLEGLGLIR